MNDSVEILSCHLAFEAKLPRMKSVEQWVGEMVDHAGGHDHNVIAPTSLNENIHLDLRDVSKEPILILARNSTDLFIRYQVKQMSHTWALVNLFGTALPTIHID